MSSQKYELGKLNSILQTLFKKNAGGVLSLKTQVPTWRNQRHCLLILQNGALVYGEVGIAKVPNNHDLCRMLGEELKPNLINAALSVASEKITDPTSVKELVQLLTMMRAFTWQEVETLIMKKVILTLEQFLPYPGKAQWQPDVDFDLSYGEDKHGLNWTNIKQQIEQRQQKWQRYAPTIPSQGAIPYVTSEQLKKISDRDVKKHLSDLANGQNTFLDIADKMGKDPLKIAKNYASWTGNGWVSIGTVTQEKGSQTVTTNDTKAKIQSMRNAIKSESKSVVNSATNNTNLPIVLSVDDSPIIQISIKRALQEQYQVLLANKAEDALKMLDQHSVQLMLLDLTMPDVDGLEFCKTVRKIPKFQDLPIVMVTARDGLVNKMKGHIAGTSKYLTKPFQPEQLREVVSEYINN